MPALYRDSGADIGNHLCGPEQGFSEPPTRGQVKLFSQELSELVGAISMITKGGAPLGGPEAYRNNPRGGRVRVYLQKLDGLVWVFLVGVHDSVDPFDIRFDPMGAFGEAPRDHVFSGYGDTSTITRRPVLGVQA